MAKAEEYAKKRDGECLGREFIVIDLTRAKEDALYLRKGWDRPLDISNE
ncbi:13686_t:CDS:2 [Entrophospora sp. SA101]|nr:13686_t:CDS:2 [Entrophospora sp. SA101]CAJ0866447.1 18757_t:CDS:2 [Entrophospora sp. SA101]